MGCKSKPKQKLGPWQKAWIESLRTGGFGQRRNRLTVTHSDGDYHCCLGVACEVAKGNGVEVKRDVSAFGIAWDKEHGHLPESVQHVFRFRSELGKFNGNRRLKGERSLADANDAGVTFAEIADFCEAHPEAVFSEPA